MGRGAERKKRVPRGEALVAIMNDLAAWRIVQQQGWYRVPVASAPRRWPPHWLAFYQTKIFANEAYSVRWYAPVRQIDRVPRRELFPNEFPGEKSNNLYYRISLHPLEPLPRPIVSLRSRRIVFIPTTYPKLMSGEEINDLYDDSPLEDALWTQMKELHLRAERQYDIRAAGDNYRLDFALFCAQGKINVETDGDAYHINREQAPLDNRRNNALTAKGWQVLRFTTNQIREEMATYCVPRLTDMVNELGGMEGAGPRKYYDTPDGIVQQMSLFDARPAYAPPSAQEDKPQQ